MKAKVQHSLTSTSYLPTCYPGDLNPHAQLWALRAQRSESTKFLQGSVALFLFEVPLRRQSVRWEGEFYGLVCDDKLSNLVIGREICNDACVLLGEDPEDQQVRRPAQRVEELDSNAVKVDLSLFT